MSDCSLLYAKKRLRDSLLEHTLLTVTVSHFSPSHVLLFLFNRGEISSDLDQGLLHGGDVVCEKMRRCHITALQSNESLPGECLTFSSMLKVKLTVLGVKRAMLLSKQKL